MKRKIIVHRRCHKCRVDNCQLVELNTLSENTQHPATDFKCPECGYAWRGRINLGRPLHSFADLDVHGDANAS